MRLSLGPAKLALADASHLAPPWRHSPSSNATCHLPTAFGRLPTPRRLQCNAGVRRYVPHRCIAILSRILEMQDSWQSPPVVDLVDPDRQAVRTMGDPRSEPKPLPSNAETLVALVKLGEAEILVLPLRCIVQLVMHITSALALWYSTWNCLLHRFVECNTVSESRVSLEMPSSTGEHQHLLEFWCRGRTPFSSYVRATKQSVFTIIPALVIYPYCAVHAGGSPNNTILSPPLGSSHKDIRVLPMYGHHETCLVSSF